jgi:hypothetical protein
MAVERARPGPTSRLTIGDNTDKRSCTGGLIKLEQTSAPVAFRTVKLLFSSRAPDAEYRLLVRLPCPILILYGFFLGCHGIDIVAWDSDSLHVQQVTCSHDSFLNLAPLLTDKRPQLKSDAVKPTVVYTKHRRQTLAKTSHHLILRIRCCVPTKLPPQSVGGYGTGTALRSYQHAPNREPL